MEAKTYLSPLGKKHLAIEVTEENISTAAQWAGGNVAAPSGLDGLPDNSRQYILLKPTKEGHLPIGVHPGDMIVKGSDGKFVGMDKEVFLSSFTPGDLHE